MSDILRENSDFIRSFGKDEYFMRLAIKEAYFASCEDEVPVGAIVVYKNKVIARAHNQVELLKDSTAHAEMLALTQAQAFLKSKWLPECTMYSTIEPCLMCTGALVLSRIERIVYAASEPRSGALVSVIKINSLNLNHKLKIKGELLKEEASSLIKNFFISKR